MKIRINDLARELEVKSKQILDVLDKVGVTEKKTHSSSVEEDEAEKVRNYIRETGGGASSRPRTGGDEFRPKIDLSKISKPGDALKAILARKEAAETPAPPPPRAIVNRLPATPPPTRAAAPAAHPPAERAPRLVTPESVAQRTALTPRVRPPAAVPRPPAAIHAAEAAAAHPAERPAAAPPEASFAPASPAEVVSQSQVAVSELPVSEAPDSEASGPDAMVSEAP